MRGVYSRGQKLAGAVAIVLALLPGAGSASSQTAPKNSGEPQILGTAVEGRILTATTGTWSGSTPLQFAYRWLRCPSDGGAPDGSNCAVIADEIRSSYRVRAGDVSLRLRVRVRATNADGAARATSNPTNLVIAAGNKPRNTSAPTISGIPAVGQTLIANAGSWSGSQPISFGYRWRRCDRNGGRCSDVDGADNRSYATSSVDAGNTLRVRVTARNSAGSAAATSAPSGVIAAPAPTGCPGGSGTARVDQLGPPARLVVDGMQISPGVIRRSTHELVARFHVSACQGRSVQGALVYAATVPFNQFSVPPEQPTGADGWVTLSMGQLSGFPAARRQQLLVMFVRARKPGESVLAGISARRLVSFPVSRSG